MQAFSTFTTSDAQRIAYRLEGVAGRPVLMLSNSIATDLSMWDGVMPHLLERFRVLRYDMRGHGASDVPAGAYSLDRLGRDALELMDALELERVHFLGLSLGGMVAQWLGVHAPERIDHLVLAHTAAYLGPAADWEPRIQTILAATPSETADAFLGNWFPAEMRERNDPAIRPFREVLLKTDARGIVGALAAVRDMDMRRTLALIPRPTLVLGGKFDTVTRAEHSEEIAAAIPGAKLVLLPAVHMSNVELREAFLAEIGAFLL
ncbi:alpha/beta fold hydrolase [Cupriavidus gilardii]|uniref:alpha/beta fold hydrolase n=1 Tax=Cupriavidus gilardii TaxID=82541 RepID=UPI001EE55E61|nr:alpha/beta fold hydrolase [Cupriavidus gilardii]MCG5261311.1 alpha/beta fold hydrolase [Cupriavidus gilardii]MDF9428581.1 alpha/beta fold hydrolase [Cupriavidus gilardii]